MFGVGVVGARVEQTATPQGIAAVYPSCATAILARSPTTQRVFTAYGTGGYVIYRTWPRGSVYEYGESISLGTAVFDDYLRIAAGATTAPTALQLLTSSDTTAVLYSRGALTQELQLDARVDPGRQRPRDAPLPARRCCMGFGQLVRGVGARLIPALLQQQEYGRRPCD